MIRFLFLLTIVCVTTLRAEEAGFVSIFNGRDLTGWTTREAMEGGPSAQARSGVVAPMAGSPAMRTLSSRP